MTRAAVVSSNIASVGYDPASQTLEVEFKNGGIYAYDDVPPDVHRDLMAADSVGQYLHQQIKSSYTARRV